MVHLLTVIGAWVLNLISKLTGLAVGGTATAAYVKVILAYTVIKVFDLFLLGIVTFTVSDSIVDLTLDQFNSLLNNLDFSSPQVNAAVVDFLDTLGVDVGISIIVSAISIALTLQAHRWATTMGRTVF